MKIQTIPTEFLGLATSQRPLQPILLGPPKEAGTPSEHPALSGSRGQFLHKNPEPPARSKPSGLRGVFKNRLLGLLLFRLILTAGAGGFAIGNSIAADLYWRTDGTSGTWTGTNWSNPATSAGGTGWTSSDNAFFTANSSVTGASTAISSITLSEGVSVTVSPGGTLTTGGTLATITIGAGSLIDFGAQQFTTAVGSGLTKNGSGTYAAALSSADLPGGFVLNAGNVIAKGGNAMGNGNLTLNGGAIGSNGNIDFETRFSGGITMGGNIQLGISNSVVSLSSSTANLTFGSSAAVSLGAATRTVTIGANGTYSLNGAVSGSSGAGLSVASSGGATGALVLGGTNTYTGATTINSGTLKLGASGSLASASALVISDGGTFDSSATSFSIGTAGLTIGVGASTAGFFNAGTVTLGNGLSLNMGTATPASSYNLWDFTSKSGNFGTVSLTGDFSGGLSRVDNIWSGTLGGLNFSLDEASGLFTVVEAAGPSYWTANGATLGGTGTWNAASSNWSSDNSTISGAAWNSADTAVFAGTAGTITVDGVTAGAGLSFSTSGYLLSSGTLTLGAVSDVANAITTEPGVTATISSVLAGSNGMSKSGAGTLVLSGTNTYSGGTNVNAGTLQGTSASLQGNIANTAIVIFDQSTNGTYSGVMSGAGSLTKNGSGRLTLSGANTYSGSTTINAGTLTLGANDVLGNSSTVNISGGTLAVGTRSETISSITQESGGLTIGSGTLTLLNASSFTGGTVTFAGSIDSRLNTSGTTTLGNVNFVFDHTSNLADSDGLNIGGSVIVGNSTTTNFTNAAAGLGRIELTSNTVLNVGEGAAVNIAWIVDQFGGTRSLTKNGSGTLTLSAANSFVGGMVLNAGTIRIGNASASGTGTLTQAGGTSLLQFNTTGTITNTMSLYNVEFLQGVTLSGGITVNNATFDVADGETTTISGVVGGAGGVTKDGAGTLILSNSNTYSGNTIVNEGALAAAAAGALASSASITVNNGGSLLITSSNAVADSATITLAGGTLAVSGNTTDTVGPLTLTANSIINLLGLTGSITFSSATGWAPSATLQIWNWTGENQFGTPVGNGSTTRQIFFSDNGSSLSENMLDRISFYSGNGTGFAGTAFMRSNEIAPVPEPEAVVTALLLMAGLGIFFWRQRAKASKLRIPH